MIAPAMIPNKQIKFNAVAQLIKILHVVSIQATDNLIDSYFGKSDSKKLKNAVKEIDALFSKRAKDLATEYQNASDFVEAATETVLKMSDTSKRKAAYRG